jgi:formylglycine-generating enzyme required for sulfatase activity
MVEGKSVGRSVSAWTVSLAVGISGLAVLATALASAQRAAEQYGSVSTSARTPANLTTNDIVFVSIAPGQFPMGCSEGVQPVECGPEEKPRHNVQIAKPFEIAATETTEKQWQAVMGSNPSHFKGDDLPVEEVTFLDVQAFLAKLNARNDGFLYRLPTEAEWEYAARAGAADQFGGAKVANSLSRYAKPDDWAWYNVPEVQPVATTKPSAWGLYDMRGNVNEWCQDWYDPKYYSKSPMADPKGPDSDIAEGGRIVRGGAFHDDGPWLTRVSLRQHFPEDYHHYDLGFRVVREKR